jgi:SAM-dependent methyltransferase
MLKLNLGCGKRVLAGYKNYDLYVCHPQITKIDIRKLPHETGTVDEILAEDILEHFPRLEWKQVLAEWMRTLKPGGRIQLQFPEMPSLVEQLLKARTAEEWEVANRRIFGAQGDGKEPGEGMYHYTGFSYRYLRVVMEAQFGVRHVSHFFKNHNCTLVMQKK